MAVVSTPSDALNPVLRSGTLRSTLLLQPASPINVNPVIRRFRMGRPSVGVSIGTAGFEPATPATPLQCATGLRHVPRRRRSGIVAQGCTRGKGWKWGYDEV